MSASDEFIAHYQQVREQRLDIGSSALERARTEQLLSRHLPQPPAVVLDVGGGPGAYAASERIRYKI